MSSWSTVPMTKQASSACLLPRNHWCTCTRCSFVSESSQSSSTGTVCSCKRIYSSFSSAMPWASRMHFSSLSGWLSAHCTSRPKIPFAVACVGKPKKIPPAPNRAARISAAASAASVLPTPIWASKIKIPGALTLLAASTAAACTALGGNPKRALNSSASTIEVCASQGAVRSFSSHLFQARSARSG